MFANLGRGHWACPAPRRCRPPERRIATLVGRREPTSCSILGHNTLPVLAIAALVLAGCGSGASSSSSTGSAAPSVTQEGSAAPSVTQEGSAAPSVTQDQQRAGFLSKTMYPDLTVPAGYAAACALDGTGLFTRSGEQDLERFVKDSSCPTALHDAVRIGVIPLDKLRTATAADILDDDPHPGEWSFNTGVVTLILDQSNTIIHVVPG